MSNKKVMSKYKKFIKKVKNESHVFWLSEKKVEKFSRNQNFFYCFNVLVRCSGG